MTSPENATAHSSATPSPRAGRTLSITPTAADAGDSWTNLDAFEFAKSNAEQHNTVVDTLACNPGTALKLATLKVFTTAGSNQALLAPDPTAPHPASWPV